MIDIKLLREEPERFKKNMTKKFMENKLHIIDDVLSYDSEWRTIKKQIDDLRKSRNELSRQANKAKKAGNDAEFQKILGKVKDIPNKINNLEKQGELVQKELKKNLIKIPNMMHESVVQGKDENKNPVIKTVGEKKEFSFPIKNHVELAEELGVVDFERAADMSGNGFYILKGDLAILNQAIIRFSLEHMQKKGYYYIEPPLMIRKKVLDAAMDTEEFAGTIYNIAGEDLNMIGTSEHALLGLHENEAINETKLPLKYYSYTMCFRKEIGSHGINEKGLWRTHQFNKIEQFIFCKPEESYQLYDELLQNTEELFQALDLHYRIVECCSGDLALWKAKSCDIEVWRPTTKDYGEVTSLSNCTDFQARGIGTKILRKHGEREFLHTLNNTAIATSRVMVAILENYQNEDGSVSIPKVLHPYMMGITKIKTKK
jgi:seryl-tRNA synthetase